LEIIINVDTAILASKFIRKYQRDRNKHSPNKVVFTHRHRIILNVSSTSRSHGMGDRQRILVKRR
jgi:hypothetical protein